MTEVLAPRPATMAAPDLAAIKQKQQDTWVGGDFATVGTTLQVVGESPAEAADVRAGETVLDVAAGRRGAVHLALGGRRRDLDPQQEHMQVFMIDHKEPSWWYWLVTAGLLTAGIAGHPEGFLGAIGLTVFQLFHFVFNKRSVRAFPVQVRFWYLMLLIVALPQPMRWLYWIPTVGTWAQVLFGYCAMARLVSLWPWNRVEPLSGGLVWRTLMSRPVRGNILQGHSALLPHESCR